MSSETTSTKTRVKGGEPLDPEAAAAKRAKAEKIGRYVAMFFMPLVMVGMMVGGYLGAMHSPSPRDVPIVVVGSQAQDFAATLEKSAPDAVEATVSADAEAAKQAVLDQDIAGAVILENGNAVVYTASGNGASLASTVTGLVAPSVLQSGLVLEAEDLAPLPASDVSGLGAMFMATALVMAGYLPFSLTLSNSPELLRFRRAVPLLAAWSALIGVLMWAVTGPLLGVVEGHAAAVIGICALGVFAIGSVQLFLTRLVGPMAVLVGMLLLMVLGIPSSNMAMSLHTLPPMFSFFHNFLPTPAVGEALRAVLYKGGAGVWPHLMVLAIGAIAGLALTRIFDFSKRRKNPDYSMPPVTVPSLHGGPRPKSRIWRYAALLFFPVAMVGMMISFMLGAMYQPAPKDMPIAIVGATAEQSQQTIDGLNTKMSGLFDLRAADTAESARNLVLDRSVSAAVVLPTAQGEPATLITNQAAGTSAKQVVVQVFTQVMAAQKMEVATEDVRPLPTDDSLGVVSMYLSMGWIMAGFMIVIVGANAQPASRPLKRLLPIVAGWSVFISAVLWLIAGPITGAVQGHFWQLFGTGIIAVFSVAMFTTVFERLIGMLAILPVVGILMFVGVPASGGAMSIYMEPHIFRVLHEILPMPAAVEAVKSILYFGGDVVGHQLLVFGIWGVASLLIVAIIDKFKPVSITTEIVEGAHPQSKLAVAS